MRLSRSRLVLLILLLVSGFVLLGFSGFSQDKIRSKTGSILLFTKDRAIRDRYVDLIIADKKFASVDVASIEDQKNIRLSKYELIALPSGTEGLKDKLGKYFKAGIGIFVYGGADSADLNALLEREGSYEDFVIVGSGESTMAKTGKLKLAKLGGSEGYSDGKFAIAGRYDEPGSYVRCVFEDESEYESKVLKALTHIHSDFKLRNFSNKNSSRICFYNYLGSSGTVIKQFSTIYRDYSYGVQGSYSFKFLSELELITDEGFADEFRYVVDTNEIASILESSPKVRPGIKSEVDKPRQKASYAFSSEFFNPESLSSKVFNCSQSFLITTDELRLATLAQPQIYRGNFRQYKMYREGEDTRGYTIELLF